MDNQDGPAFIDFVRRPDETAKRLGVSVRTLRRIEKRGEIEATSITERIKGFRDSAINKFLNSRNAAA
jgi:predicted site-specific integrase-resolvase